MSLITISTMTDKFKIVASLARPLMKQYATPVYIGKLLCWLPTGIILPSAANCFIKGLARDATILNLSVMVEMVIKLIFGTSLFRALCVSSSINTLLFNLSFTFPLDHFFFPPFFDAAAALAMASLVFFLTHSWLFSHFFTLN